MADINRLMALLAEKGKTNRWLCNLPGVDQSTVSKWITNYSQSSVERVFKSMEVRDVDIDQVINIPQEE